MNWHSYHTNGPNKRRRKGISASCQSHRGPVDFADLLVSMREGWIVLDLHVTSACVMALDEKGARTLLFVLTEWLG